MSHFSINIVGIIYHLMSIRVISCLYLLMISIKLFLNGYQLSFSSEICNSYFFSRYLFRFIYFYQYYLYYFGGNFYI